MTVLPSDFARKMESIWTEELGNSSSPAFKQMWEKMGETFHQAIEENMAAQALSIPPGWFVLSPEMGAGKTIGSLLYLGMLATVSKRLPPPVRIGGMFIARTKKQCDEAVETINRYAGFKAAISRHSGNSNSLEECRKYPIVVITHASAVQDWSATYSGILDQFGEWDGGRRCLTIIDEALLNAFDTISLTQADLLEAMASVSSPLQKKHLEAYSAITGMLEFIEVIQNRLDKVSPIWDGTATVIEEADRIVQKLDLLLMDIVTDISFVSRAKDNEDKQSRLDRIKTTFHAISALHRQWCLFDPSGREPTLMSGVSKVPNFFAPVLLNATASYDTLLTFRRSRHIQLPTVRSYKNLHIHVLRTNGIGKKEMYERREARLQRLKEFINEQTEAEDEWMIVTHKLIEQRAKRLLPSGCCCVGHWGDLDGRNDFRHCNKAVLFGLSFKAPEWPIILYFAMLGMRPQEWLASNEAKQMKKRLEFQDLTSQILQAVGRTRCRKVIDSDGNCLPTDIYLMLPDNIKARNIEAAIKQELPGVRLSDWHYVLDGSNKSKKSQSPYKAKLVDHMQQIPPGRYGLPSLCEEIGLSDEEIKNVKDQLKKKRGLYQALLHLDVECAVEGKGRGAETYLVKG